MRMKLSVVIVSYHVRYFLEKCLLSVVQAMHDIDGEIIVVDNASADGSAGMVRSRFPAVALICNTENLGFAKACNQGIASATGAYVLLLNPDTLVSEKTFAACIAFMEAHPEAGAAGVRMIDGSGQFLPESMRGLPAPFNAFCKMTGLNALFPRSRLFNGYYMGGLDPGAVHEVPVLTGAFLFTRAAVLRETGGLDERYFMYGEDIDLCYRILRAGYRNYYLPEPSIVHYKGESTHRGSMQYVRIFYRAMLIYVNTHYRGVRGAAFVAMIKLGVFVRGLLSGIGRIAGRALFPVLDAVFTAGAVIAAKELWARWYFGDAGHFDTGFLLVNFPLYTGIWLLFLFLSGAHDRYRNTRRVTYGILTGTVAILVIYALLPVQYRSSRAVIFLSATLVLILTWLSTAVISRFRQEKRRPRRAAIVGHPPEVQRIMELLNRTRPEMEIAGSIAIEEDQKGPDHLGPLDHLEVLVDTYAVGELIFSSTDVPFSAITGWMARIGPRVAYRIASSGSEQIVGSDSKFEQGVLYTPEVQFAIAMPWQRRSKRLFDVVFAVSLLLILPFVFIGSLRRGRTLWMHIRKVLSGHLTWVGYAPADPRPGELPVLRPGVISAGSREARLIGSELHLINYIYAREYSVWRDIDLMLRNTDVLVCKSGTS